MYDVLVTFKPTGAMRRANRAMWRATIAMWRANRAFWRATTAMWQANRSNMEGKQ